MSAYWLYGMVLGLGAGLSPGPLLALVISHTVQHGPGEGIKVAMAPLLTDAGILAAAYLFFTALPDPGPALGVVSLLGGGFVLFLGLGNLRQGPVEVAPPPARPRSLLKGAAVNALSPHPYLFWLSVGVPTMLQAGETTSAGAAGFALCFLGFLVGSKVAVAMLVGRSQRFLQGRPYLFLLRGLGLLLIVFSLKLFREGLVLLGLA